MRDAERTYRVTPPELLPEVPARDYLAQWLADVLAICPDNDSPFTVTFIPANMEIRVTSTHLSVVNSIDRRVGMQPELGARVV